MNELWHRSTFWYSEMCICRYCIMLLNNDSSLRKQHWSLPKNAQQHRHVGGMYAYEWQLKRERYPGSKKHDLSFHLLFWYCQERCEFSLREVSDKFGNIISDSEQNRWSQSLWGWILKNLENQMERMFSKTQLRFKLVFFLQCFIIPTVCISTCYAIMRVCLLYFHAI